MTNTPLKKFFVASMLAGGMFAALPSAAEFIPNQESAEAEAISVTFGKGKHDGTVDVTGCTACPLALDIDAGTRFYFKKKQIKSEEIAAHSGKPGTVFYHKDTKQAVKIHW